MDPGPPSDPPTPDPAVGPTPADVLRWCADAAPAVWFPSAYAQTAGVPRDSIDDPLWLLRQAGLGQVADWGRGRGPGDAPTSPTSRPRSPRRRRDGATPASPPTTAAS